MVLIFPVTLSPWKSPKGQDWLRPPQPSCWLRIFIRLITRTLCWLEKAIQLNLLTKTFPVLPGNSELWENYFKGKGIKKTRSFSLGKAMSWSRVGTEGFLKRSNVRMLSTLSYQKKSDPCKGEIHFFIFWNTLPRVQNFKPKFEFQTSLEQNSPVGTSELLPYCWDNWFQQVWPCRQENGFRQRGPGFTQWRYT